MSQATVNGATVLGGVITMPRVGVWRADLDVDLADAKSVTGKVELVVDGLTWKGTTLEAGAFAGRTKVRLVGGAGGLGKATKPRFYHAIPARTVASDVLAEGEEALSSTADADVLGAILELWTRPAAIVSEGLDQLLDELGATWRVLRDGTVWIGKESWPDASDVTDVQVLVDAAHDAQMTVTSAVPNIVPGTIFRERRVSRVEVHVGASELRSVLWFESEKAEAGGDVLRLAIERVVRQATRHIDYYAIYGGKVVAQNGDGSLEIKLDAAHLPGMSRVPIAYGIPGISVTVATGARVHVEFEGGSPAKPRAVVTDSSKLKTITLKASTKVTIDAPDIDVQSGRPLARVGDMVQVVSTPPGTPAIGQIMTGNNRHRG